MGVEDIAEVIAIENQCYDFPWTPGNFTDSIKAGYTGQMLRHHATNELIAYWVVMAGYQEMHLLNITVAPMWQGQGYALTMLDLLLSFCKHQQSEQLWLEVRPSNDRARQVYERYGFCTVGLRKAYYPAANQTREDALVMSFQIQRQDE